MNNINMTGNLIDYLPYKIIYALMLSRGNPDYPLPVFPKNESELYFTEFSTSKATLYLHLNPLNSLYFQGFFSPYPEIQNDLIERIFPLYKVVLLLLILFLGLPQIAFAGYSGVPRDNFLTPVQSSPAACSSDHTSPD